MLYFMPYLKIAYPHVGPREVRIGKAIFFEDSHDNWVQVVGRPRPKHLEIHRRFPRIGQKVGDPLFGTLVRCDDEAWLADNIDSAVAVLYFLGDQDDRGRPAECFAYHRFSLHEDVTAANDLVSYQTKHGCLIESSDSLSIYPPLAVRANTGSYRLAIDSPEHQQLLARFAAQPDDRLVVAVRQYFRSQFSDIFTSPPAEDYALHCGAIEAALNIDGLKPGVGERFAQALLGVFGNQDRFEEFFLGLYVSRSVFVHGVASGDSNESLTKEAVAYRLFKGVRCKITLMRRITREVILEVLGRKKDPFGLLWDRSASCLLMTVLHSSATWEELKRLFTRARAADEVEKLSPEEFQEVQELAFKIDHCFDWSCVEQEVDKAQVLKAICTGAILLGRMTKSSGPVYEQSDRLGKAAAAKDEAAIEAWVLEDPWHDRSAMQGRLAPIASLTLGLARKFDKT